MRSLFISLRKFPRETTAVIAWHNGSIWCSLFVFKEKVYLTLAQISVQSPLSQIIVQSTLAVQRFHKNAEQQNYNKKHSQGFSATQQSAKNSLQHYSFTLITVLKHQFRQLKCMLLYRYICRQQIHSSVSIPQLRTCLNKFGLFQSFKKRFLTDLLMESVDLVEPDKK